MPMPEEEPFPLTTERIEFRKSEIKKSMKKEGETNRMKENSHGKERNRSYKKMM